jgi:hypothetical protein
MQISSPIEKYLPNLLNLMYSCSSLVKDLAPEQSTRTILLKLLTILTQSSNTKLWTTVWFFNHNWRSKNPNDMIQDNLEIL